PSTVLLDHRLEHDHHGRLLGWSDGTQQRRYLVDATGRLLQAAHRSAVGSAQFWRFAYDAQGNRRFAQAPTPNAPAGLTQKFQRDGLSNRLASPGRSTPGQTSQQAWDAAGRLVRNGRWSYRWDADGRLEQASWDGSPVARYRYNHRGQRIARQVGGQVTHYLYDAQRRLLAELDERGTVQRQYLYLADWPVAVLDRIRAPETPENSVASARPVFQIRFLHLNHLGAPELVTNIRGQVLWRATYAPFGRRLAGSEPAP
ncbi:MAG: RHS domain-containing protein, partial [Quisquiliibacterium sp.]